MERHGIEPHIAESFLEYRQSFAEPWINRWILPNPFISALFDALREYDVALSDFSFGRDATNVGDTCLNVTIRKLSAAIKLGLDSIVFSAVNPDWGEASHLIGAFERAAQVVREIVRAAPYLQEATLLFHVAGQSADLKAATAKLVNTKVIGDADFYGISIHRSAGQLLIEKSLKYDDAAFCRIQHKFAGVDSLAAVAAKLYKEEMFSLGLLGLMGPEDSQMP